MKIPLPKHLTDDDLYGWLMQEWIETCDEELPFADWVSKEYPEAEAMVSRTIQERNESIRSNPRPKSEFIDMLERRFPDEFKKAFGDKPNENES